jgi:hypothetical protein
MLWRVRDIRLLGWRQLILRLEKPSNGKRNYFIIRKQMSFIFTVYHSFLRVQKYLFSVFYNLYHACILRLLCAFKDSEVLSNYTRLQNVKPIIYKCCCNYTVFKSVSNTGNENF